MKLQTQILFALAAGVAVAGVARALGWGSVGHLFLVLEPLGTLFIRLISMVVVPLVIASVFVSIASLGETGAIGRIGGWTLAFFLATTIAAATIGTITAVAVGLGKDATVPERHPTEVRVEISKRADPPPVSPDWLRTVVDLVPQNPFKAAADGELLPLILAVCLFGAAAVSISAAARHPVVSLLTSANDMCMVVIGWIMRLAPFAVFMLIGVTITRSGFDLLRNLVTFIVVVLVALAIHVAAVLLPLLASSVRSVTTFVRATSEALVLAFSTASSTATLPVSMANAEAAGVPARVASAILPAGSTLNKNGAAAYKAVTAVFLAHVYGLPLGPVELVTVILASTMAAFAGAGVPGSSLVTTMIVLRAIGLGSDAAAGIALVAGVDRPLDMCRTTVNTFSNLVGAAFVARRVR